MAGRTYKIYIIHSPSSSENYIDRTLATEQQLMEAGHEILNPLPDQHGNISNEFLHRMYCHRMHECEMAYAMEGWDKTDVGNAEMAEMMIHRKTIAFEQEAWKCRKERAGQNLARKQEKSLNSGIMAAYSAKCGSIWKKLFQWT